MLFGSKIIGLILKPLNCDVVFAGAVHQEVHIERHDDDVSKPGNYASESYDRCVCIRLMRLSSTTAI